MIQRKLPKPAAPAAADNKSADRELPQTNRKHFVRIPTVEIYPICKSELQTFSMKILQAGKAKSLNTALYEDLKITM